MGHHVLKLVAGLGQCIAQPLALFFDGFGLNAIVHDLEGSSPHDHGTAYGIPLDHAMAPQTKH
jgi:hypothetical protein